MSIAILGVCSVAVSLCCLPLMYFQYLFCVWACLAFLSCCFRPCRCNLPHPTVSSSVHVGVIAGSDVGPIPQKYLKSIFSPFLPVMSHYSMILLLVLFCSNVPFRVRVRLSRKRNEDEESANKLYTLVTYVPVDTFKGKDHISPCVTIYQNALFSFVLDPTRFSLTSAVKSPPLENVWLEYTVN